MYTHEQKISHLQALYHLALVDGVLSKEEVTYIELVAERLGISLSELQFDESTTLDLILPDREYKLYSLFHRLAVIIMIDDHVHHEEAQHCFNLGIKMGLHPNAIKEIITYITTSDFAESPTEIIAIFKKYMN